MCLSLWLLSSAGTTGRVKGPLKVQLVSPLPIPNPSTPRSHQLTIKRLNSMCLSRACFYPVFNMNVLYLLAIALPSLARNLCPGHEPPVLSRCNSDTLHSALPKGAFIETAREVNQGGCFGEDTFSNIFQCEECCLSSNHWDFGCNYAAYLPASCAVTVNMGTYRFGLIMPITTLWSGSLMAVGSSSYGGGINWKDMWTGPTYYGLATLSTDTGHRSVGSDMSWAKNNSQAQADWGYRSINGSTRAAKSLLEAYHLYPYNKVRYSYFSGCSTGGRQGIKQLEIDQSLFDGLLIGAPPPFV